MYFLETLCIVEGCRSRLDVFPAVFISMRPSGKRVNTYFQLRARKCGYFTRDTQPSAGYFWDMRRSRVRPCSNGERAAVCVCQHAEEWTVSDLRMGNARRCGRATLFIFHDTHTSPRSVMRRSRCLVGGGARVTLDIHYEDRRQREYIARRRNYCIAHLGASWNTACTQSWS